MSITEYAQGGQEGGASLLFGLEPGRLKTLREGFIGKVKFELSLEGNVGIITMLGRGGEPNTFYSC